MVVGCEHLAVIAYGFHGQQGGIAAVRITASNSSEIVPELLITLHQRRIGIP